MRRVVFIYIAFFLCSLNIFGQEQCNLSYPRFKQGEIVIRHTGHTLSYNPDAMIPNWVAYILRRSNLEGNAQRASSFSPDPSPLLKGYKLAEHRNYSYSGWARGHMAPAGDFKYSQEAMNDTFYTTNICPMDMTFNNGIWKRLEEKIRKLAIEHGCVYIITGPLIGDNIHGKVGESDIIVPDSYFKAILVPYNGTYLAIGFYLDNEPAPKGTKLKDYAVSIGWLQEKTGMKFFAGLDKKTAAKIEKSLPLKELGLY